MNRRRLTPITARALAAALMLAALWPVGCCAAGAADTARQTSAARPAASADKPDKADALPASFQGRWTSISSGFDSDGPLTLGARTLRWPNLCGKAVRRIKLDTDSEQLAAYPAFDPDGPKDDSAMPQALIDLTADGAPPCNLDTLPLIYLRLKLGSLINPGDVCAMQVSFYGYGPQPRGGPWTGPKFLAWETFTNERFIPDKGLFLPCPAARKAAQAAASSAAPSTAKGLGQ
jgi:hypothetical protein